MCLENRNFRFKCTRKKKSKIKRVYQCNWLSESQTIKFEAIRRAFQSIWIVLKVSRASNRCEDDSFYANDTVQLFVGDRRENNAEFKSDLLKGETSPSLIFSLYRFNDRVFIKF